MELDARALCAYRRAGEVNAKGGVKGVDQLPWHWRKERFTAVDVGGGELGLYSEASGSFVVMEANGRVHAGGPKRKGGLGSADGRAEGGRSPPLQIDDIDNRVRHSDFKRVVSEFADRCSTFTYQLPL